jgi:hypothetical protein
MAKRPFNFIDFQYRRNYMKTNLSFGDNQSADEKKKRTKRIFMVVLLCLLILILFLAYINTLCPDPSMRTPSSPISSLDQSGNAIDGTANPKSMEEILDDLERQQLVVTDKLSSNITFPAGDSGTIGDWIVENPASNNITQQAEVYFENQMIAKSAPIYPNQHIEKIELLQDMHSGEYDVIAYINYYDMETQEFISRAGYSIHLTVR